MNARRRALTLVGLLVVLAGVMALTMRRTGSGSGSRAAFTVDRAAELAPAEIDYFLALPDIDRMATRWKENEFHPFELGPEGPWDWREALARALPPMPYQRRFLLLEEFAKIQPAALWLATKTRRDAYPETIVGIRFRGKKTDVEGAIRRLKEKLFAEWPGATSELSSESGIELESIAVPRPPTSVSGASTVAARQPSAQIAFRDDWVFLGTDRAMFIGTLRRYAGAAEAGKGLAGKPSFAEYRRHPLPEADVCIWANWAPVALRPLRFGSRLLPDQRLLEVPRDEEIIAAHFECRVDGATSGRLNLQFGKPVVPSLFELQLARGCYCGGYSLVLADEEDAVEAFAAEWRRPKLTLDARNGSAWMPGGLAAQLAMPRTSILEDLAERFGPDLTIVFLERERAGLPDFVAALEVPGEREAFRLAAAIAEAESEAALDQAGLFAAAAGPPGLIFSLCTDSIERQVHRRAFPRLRVKLSGGKQTATGESARFFVELPGVMERNQIELPALSLIYEPWLLPRRVDYHGHQPLPAPMRVRKDGKHWVIDSDLNGFGHAFLRGWMNNQSGNER